ncbi:endothelin-converting enzyme homolog isoform X2 [Folsomia candida]|uniref:Endothelin-converting enzyme 1 n=2 Tax=Folsomia candida TaxID=158441 RepID=A0A226EVN8_FOLCA|nr:endothelin-converting enzyme homolog isoform X2 [Folsomia candida]XP_035702121.1 endothelin-converting enzyme homolog isoform X2 [Folsomia candida]XP_035702122.1 endothelin-converting enzyme homolog isoform X2 [Folsomia candida]XP_035702123.1 endothelin-converting enzyme homolog isoform X2 [Folsomia candida]OXA61237.1 Endothelin-converting enzyme 1 [Folsomia candida]
MAKYKRAELMEEEDSVHLDHMKTHVIPIQPPGIWTSWKSRSLLEKFLASLSALLVLLLISVLFLLCKTWNSWYILRVEHQTTDLCLTPTCIKVSSNILTSLDTTMNPCQDFYQYACGGWIRSNPIPEGKSTWGTFQKLWQQNQLVMKISLEKEDLKKSKAEMKASLYYQSCMDKDEIQTKLGAEPLIKLLAEVGGWSVTPSGFNVSTFSYQKQMQILHNDYNMGGFFTWAVGEDDRNSTRHVIQLDQGGLTLPTRDYYLNSTHEKVREVCIDYMVKLSTLLGARDENKTREYMQGILDFETELAKITSPSDERRDDEKLYHALNLTDLQNLAPAISWETYFNSGFDKINRTIKPDETVVVYAPEFLTSMSQLIMTKNATAEGRIILNNYLVWHTVKAMTCCLSKPFKDVEKLLRKAILGSDGTEEQWRVCVSDTNNNMGFAVGSMFVREAFHSNAKPLAQEMIEQIRIAFQDNLRNLAWMDDETRQLAKEKAAAITDMIGFPEFILNQDQLDKKYDNLTINQTDYFGNNIRVSKFSLLKNLEKLDEPVNRTKWGMTPPTVNAYYTPTSNQMVIPAGILQWPFFSPDFPKSVNYGAIGVVMGHELTHAFDDQGREYDKEGNLHQWWQNATIDRFKKATECVINQYSSFKVEGEFVNGKQTLGENIADNGGLKAAFHAYRNSKIKDLPLPGLNITHDQLFFISFAQVWCSSSLKETLILQLENDPHVPAPLRVRGPLSNLPEFAKTFRCTKGTRMNPEKKCTVW